MCDSLSFICGVNMAEIVHMDTPNGDIELPFSPLRPSIGERCTHCFSELGRWEVWKAILLGQLLSAFICGTAVSSQYLSGHFAVMVPTAQSFLNYVLLCMVYTTCLACRSGDQGLIPVLRMRGWKYFLLAMVDVEANYLVVKAYHYTTLTSVQLLDCFTIPVVLALSWLVLKVRYKIVHILGVGICLLGVGCVVWADVDEGKGGIGGSDRLLGDMLCLSGATLYGISNVAEEFVVKMHDCIEFLGMLGLFGSVINGIQLAILERQEVAVIRWEQWQIVALVVGFAVCLFLLYSIMSVVMRISSATAVNLSILSADFYSLLIGVFLFQFKFHALYILSFTFVIVGVVVYSLKPTPLISQPGHYREMALLSENQDAILELSHHLPGSPSCNSVRGLPCRTFHMTPDESTGNTPSGVIVFEHMTEVHPNPASKMNGSPGRILDARF